MSEKIDMMDNVHSKEDVDQVSNQTPISAVHFLVVCMGWQLTCYFPATENRRHQGRYR